MANNDIDGWSVMALFRADIEDLDGNDAATAEHYEKLAAGLTDDEMRYLANYIGDWLYDGDQWQQALRAGLRELDKDTPSAYEEA